MRGSAPCRAAADSASRRSISALRCGRCCIASPHRPSSPPVSCRSRQRGDRSCAVRRTRGHVGKRHALALEVVALRERDPHPLDAAVGVNQARGDADGHLVRVVDAVVPAELVLREHRREADVLQAAFEVGKPALIAERDVDVIELRLERLDERQPGEYRVALENEAAVGGENRQRARAVLVTQRVLAECVAGHVHADLSARRRRTSSAAAAKDSGTRAGACRSRAWDA